MFENIQIAAADELKWGKLVRSWATGKSEFPNEIPDAKLRVPTDLADLKAQCAKVGVSITIPASFKGLVVIQQSPETLVLRLPSAKMVKEALEDLSAPANGYKLPHFYTTFGPVRVPPQDKEKFQALRIGDYTIGSCH
jgi:hypothetical protein